MTTPSRRASERNMLMIVWLSCDCGNTQWSGCMVSGTPRLSNHLKASCGEKSLNSRFISLWPRGYTSCRSGLASSNVLVQLQRPPPDTSTLRSTRLPRSRIVTSIEGLISLRFMAKKNPAAPPPTIAVFMTFPGMCLTDYTDVKKCAMPFTYGESIREYVRPHRDTV